MITLRRAFASGQRPRLASLRWRLTAWVAVMMLASAAVTYAVVSHYVSQQLRGQIQRDIGGDATQLGQSLQLSGARTPARVAAFAQRSLRGQPYDATATVLVVMVPGQGALSNHPELLGSPTPDDGESLAEQQQENAQGRQLLRPRQGAFTLMLPDVGDVRLVERSVTIDQHLSVRVIAGEPLIIVARAERGVTQAFVLAAVLILILALVASYVAGARFSAPLRRMAAVAARVDAGDLHPRMRIEGRREDEIRILVGGFNHMLDRLAGAFAAQQEFVADASHELRTPLTVIRGQLEVLASADAVSAKDVRRVERLVQAEVARISRLVDDLLLLAQSEEVDFLQVEAIDLHPFITELWDGIATTTDRTFTCGGVPDGLLLADPDRLAQALRNLAHNAIQHTEPGRGIVSLSVQVIEGRQIRLVVEDDGPGVPEAARERVFERFGRTDVARSRAAGGAGRFELKLPGFTPVPARDPSQPAIHARG